MSFFLFALDKHLAKIHARRISEKALLSFAAAFGGFGAYLSMQLFRHKTKHKKFVIGVPLLMIVQAAILWYLFIR